MKGKNRTRTSVTRLRPRDSANEASLVEDGFLKQFEEFSEMTREFSRRVSAQVQPTLVESPGDTAARNLVIVRTVFSKWNLEILALLYSLRKLGFEEIRRRLGTISAPVLSRKLRFLHQQGLIERTVISTPVLRVNYSLTPRGLTVAQLGEPVLLYLRVSQGMYHASERFVRQRGASS